MEMKIPLRRTASVIALAASVSVPAMAHAESCPSPAPGTLGTPVKVPSGERGSFSIDMAPHIAELSAQEICANQAALIRHPGGGTLGLADYVLNTRAGRLELFEIPAVAQLLQQQLDSFAAVWPYEKPASPTRILFHASDAYNAFVLADGTMVISLGLIEASDSDSELLFTLAHEYSHLLMGHHAKETSVGFTKAFIDATANAYQTGVYVSELRSQVSQNGVNLSVKDQKHVQEAASRASAASEAARFAMDDVFEPAWNRGQENEADSLGIDLLIRSHKTIDSYEKVFDRLQSAFNKQQQSENQRAQIADQVQSSLESASKDAMSQDVLNSLATTGGVNMGLLREEAGKVAQRIGKAILKVFAQNIHGADHLSPEQRRTGLAAYFKAGYSNIDPPPIDNGELIARIKKMPEYKNAIALTKTYIAARDDYEKLDFAGADRQLRSIGAGNASAPTFVNYLAGLAARDAGNTKKAEAYFDDAREGGGVPSVQVYETEADMDLADHQPQLAQQVISQGQSKFHDTDHFLSYRIRVSLAENDTSTAQTLYSECTQVKHRDYIPERCKEAMSSGNANPSSNNSGRTGQPSQGGITIPGLGVSLPSGIHNPFAR